LLIDGLQCGHFNRGVFEELNKGGIGAVTVTLGFWEGAIESMDAIAFWRDMEREDGDVFGIVLSYNCANCRTIRHPLANRKTPWQLPLRGRAR